MQFNFSMKALMHHKIILIIANYITIYLSFINLFLSYLKMFLIVHNVYFKCCSFCFITIRSLCSRSCITRSSNLNCSCAWSSVTRIDLVDLQQKTLGLRFVEMASDSGQIKITNIELFWIGFLKNISLFIILFYQHYFHHLM